MAAPGFFPCPDAGSIWSSCVFTQMLTAFDQTLRQSLTTGVIGQALALLQVLGALEVAILCVWWALYDEGDQFLANLLIVGVRIGIFAQLIAEIFPMAMMFADGAIQVGLTLGGNRLTLAQFHDPGAIMLVGWRLFTPLFQYIENVGLSDMIWHTATIVLYGLVSIAGWACVLWIGLNIIVGWVELMLLASFGTALLPFMIFEYTRFLSSGILSTIAASALRMGVLATLLALIFPVLASLTVTDAGDPGWDTALALPGSVFLFAYLTYRAQALASMVSGSSAAYTGGGLLFMGAQARRMAQQMPGVSQAMSAMRNGGSAPPARVARSA